MNLTAAPRTRWLAFRPLRHRNFALVWAASLVSNIGTWMETVAVGDLIADRTGEAGWTALVAAAGFLPMGLLAPIGGAIADRVDRRRLLIGATTANMACAAALTALSAADRASPGVIVVVVFLAGCVNGLTLPAMQAMLPDLVPADEILSAMSLGQAQFNFGRVVGPALAGVAIATGSYTMAFTINTVSFAAMLASLSALRLPAQPHPADASSIWRRIRVGAQVARRDPGINSAIVTISIAALTASPFIALIPAMARVRHDGGETLTSAFVTAQGVGAVAGAIVVPVIAERIGRRRLLMLTLGALPATLVLYGAAPTPLLAILALIGVGATYLSMLSGLSTVTQMRAPAEARARVLSLYFVALGTLYPVGALIQGPIADHVGLGAVTIGGACIMVASLAAIRLVRPQRLRALDDLDAFPGPLPAEAASGAGGRHLTK